MKLDIREFRSTDFVGLPSANSRQSNRGNVFLDVFQLVSAEFEASNETRVRFDIAPIFSENRKYRYGSSSYENRISEDIPKRLTSSARVKRDF